MSGRWKLRIRKLWTASGIFVGAAILVCLPHYFERETTELDIYWMPYCPYAQTAINNLLALDEGVFLNAGLYYISQEHLASVPMGKSRVQYGDSALSNGCQSTQIALSPDFGRFSSLHGRLETEEAIRQVVIRKRWPKFFVSYLKGFLNDPNAAWQSRAEKANIPVPELNDLVQSSVGADWFSANIRQVRDKEIAHSPTLIVKGKTLSRFPPSQEDLRVLLCSAGVLEENCRGVLCHGASPCPDRLGYVGKCKQGKCVYETAPQRSDAVSAWLIIPENCVPAEEFPLGEAIKGWASFLNITRIGLAEAKAQELLVGSKITSFPVLVVEGSLSDRAWGQQCIRELDLVSGGGRFLVTFDYKASPFVTYAQIVRDEAGLRVKLNHYSGALVLHQMGQLEAAAKSYRLALAENPKDYRAWNNLGAILYDTHGLKQLGGTMFQRAVDLNVAYEAALSNLLRSALDRQDATAIAAAKERLGWLALEKKDWREAGDLLLEVAKNREWEFSARKGLAFIAVQESRPAEALKELERCLELKPEPDGDFANLLAGVHFRLGDHAKAVTWYERALDGSSQSDQAFPNLCFLLRSTEQWEKLLSVSNKAFSLYPNNRAFGFYKAEALARLNHPWEAISLLEELSQTCEESAFRSAYELAMLYGSQGEKLRATKFAKRFVQSVAIQRRPAVRDECMNIGKMLLEFGDHGLATEAFQQVLRVKPSDVTAHRLLATCYRKVGQQDLGEEHSTLVRQFGGEAE